MRRKEMIAGAAFCLSALFIAFLIGCLIWELNSKLNNIDECIQSIEFSVYNLNIGLTYQRRYMKDVNIHLIDVASALREMHDSVKAEIEYFTIGEEE